MRNWIPACAGMTILAATLALAQPTKPATYALVSAVGDQFNMITEQQSTGTRLPPFQRTAMETPHNMLNRIVLGSLDRSIVKTDPTAKRTFLALTPPAGRFGALRGEALVEWAADELRKMPEREQWDSILLATPAFRAMSKDRLAPRMSGLGIFYEPLCQGDTGWGPRAGMGGCDFSNGTGNSGVSAITANGEPVNGNYFLAPYSFIEVWVLDPKTLKVLDRGQSLDHEKIADPHGTGDNPFSGIDGKLLAERFVGLIERSVAAAVADSEKRGKVDVRMKKEVKPGPASPPSN